MATKKKYKKYIADFRRMPHSIGIETNKGVHMKYKTGLMTVSVRIPIEWAERLKTAAQNQVPPKTREALLFKMVESGMRKLKG